MPLVQKSLNWFEKEKSKFCKVDFTKPEKQKESYQTAEEKNRTDKKDGLIT